MLRCSGAQTVEELRRAVRALTDRLGQTAVQRSLNLNSADMALLGSLQQVRVTRACGVTYHCTPQPR